MSRSLRIVGWLAALILSDWVAANAAPVVPGYELLLQQSADPLQAGLLLLGELGCANCHEPDSDVAGWISTPAASRLTTAASRLRAPYLRSYLANPQSSKPGATMPRQLRDLTPRGQEDAVNALTDFLLSSTDQTAEPQTEPGDARLGQELYHRVGCVACHEPDRTYRPESSTSDPAPPRPARSSVPLGDLGRKYRQGQLARFLLDPLETRPSARMPRTPLTSREAADLAAYLAAGEPKQSPSSETVRDKVAQGRDLFEETGCASCHEMVVNGVRLRSRLSARPLSELLQAPTQGCLADTPPPTAPDFALTAEQRKALRQAITHLTTTAPSRPLDALLRRQLAALNCLACHIRDGLGGPEPARAAFFEPVEDRDLGDEGRFPPLLTGVGRKLARDALRHAIRAADRVRPYLATRMPDYGSAHADALAELFERVDLTDDIAPVERTGRNRYGRELIGQAGLGCVGCHDLQGHKSSGIGAIDLAHSPDRLRVEWFRDFLIDPSRFAPGTRMPSFWPRGEAVNKAILGGNTARQIDSLWVYLMEIDQTRLPDGMEEKQAFELKPADRPIVFRTFMTGVGMHAVAIGFPEGIHAAFDSQQIRWAQAWRGRFLDAESTWDDRFTPLTAALSDDLVALPPGPPFAVLPDDHAPWPTSTAFPEDYRFRGFRLDGNGAPIFLYEFAGLQFEDRVRPTTDGRSLRRDIKVLGSAPPRLWFRAASGDRIERLANGSYRIDDKLIMQLVGIEPIIRQRQATPLRELLVPLTDVNGEAILKQEFTW